MSPLDTATVILFSARGRDRLMAATARIAQARAEYGDEAVTPMALSFLQAFSGLVNVCGGAGGGTIVAEDNLSLTCRADNGLEVGMIWRAEDRRDTLRRIGKPETWLSMYTDEHLARKYPTECGTWELHS